MKNELWNAGNINMATELSAKRLSEYKYQIQTLFERPGDEIFTKEYYQNWAHTLEKRLIDQKLVQDRRSNQLCQACYFDTKLVGRAMTKSHCQNCGTKIINSSTDVAVLCMACANRLQCCRHCGGRMD